MNVLPCECEIATVEIVPIDINQGQYEAFGLEASFLVNALNVDFEVDVFQQRRVEIGL